MDKVEDTSRTIPRVNLGEVLRYQKKVYPILRQYIGRVLDGGALYQLTHALLPCFKPTSVNIAEAVAPSETRRGYLWTVINDASGGLCLDDETAVFLAIRLSGNSTAFREGYPLSPWKKQRQSEWVITEIVGAVRHITRGKRMPGGMFTFSVLSGEPAGMTFDQFIPDFAAEKLAVAAGVRVRKMGRLMHPRELVRARLYALLQSGNELKIERYIVRDSIKQRNKHRVDSRKQKSNCIEETKYPCHFCPHGYQSCVNGTHKNDYVPLQCRRGHEGMKDPDWESKARCVACEASAWWAAG